MKSKELGLFLAVAFISILAAYLYTHQINQVQATHCRAVGEELGVEWKYSAKANMCFIRNNEGNWVPLYPTGAL